MQAITDISEFQNMLAAERAMVFIQARWSCYAMRTREILRVFEQRMNSNDWKFALGLTLWEIDLSDQEGEIWEATRNWLVPQCDNLNQLMWGGGGSIVWCSTGNVAKSVVRIEQLINVIELTRATFE